MKHFNPSTHYTIGELSIITGLESSRFYSYKNIFEMEKFYLPSHRTGYGIAIKNFEKVLSESKNSHFHVEEFEKYYYVKRPIKRHFLNAKETHRFCELVGDPYSIYSINRKLREGRIPAYVIKRKYLVSIHHLIERYSLTKNHRLNLLLEEILGTPYDYDL